MAKSRSELIQDPKLFREDGFSEAYAFATTATLGLLRLYRLSLDLDRIYLVDVGYNEIFAYDRESARHHNKLFWKLNLDNAPRMQVVSYPRRFDIGIDVEKIPSFDSQFGDRGGWVTMDFRIRVQVQVERDAISMLHHSVSPVTTIQNAATRAARRYLPFTSYQEALIATAEQDIQAHIRDDERVRTTGLEVLFVEIEGIEGSRQLSDVMQQSFSRMLTASDRRQAALMFADMDRDIFQRMIEAEEPRAALEFRGRAANQMLEAMLASGMNPVDTYKKVGSIARDIGHADLDSQGFAKVIASEAFEMIDARTWPALQVPTNLPSHLDRLRWEREVVVERVPTQVQAGDETSDTFAFALKPDAKMEVIWSVRDFPPQVYVNGKDRSSDYVILAPGVYDYHRTTVWDLYLETRKLLGLDQAALTRT